MGDMLTHLQRHTHSCFPKMIYAVSLGTVFAILDNSFVSQPPSLLLNNKGNSETYPYIYIFILFFPV